MKALFLAVGAAVLIACSETQSARDPLDTTVCAVLADPSAFSGKLVRFRAGVLTDWHHGIALLDRSCRGAIQLSSTDAVSIQQSEALDAAVGTLVNGGPNRTAVATFTGRVSWESQKSNDYMDNPLKLDAHVIERIEVSPRWER